MAVYCSPCPVEGFDLRKHHHKRYPLQTQSGTFCPFRRQKKTLSRFPKLCDQNQAVAIVLFGDLFNS